MLNLKIAYSSMVENYFKTNRELVLIQKTDFTDVGAIILTKEEVYEYIDRIEATQFGIPVFVVLNEGDRLQDEYLSRVYHIQDLNSYDINLYSRQIETAANLYEEKYYRHSSKC